MWRFTAAEAERRIAGFQLLGSGNLNVDYLWPEATSACLRAFGGS